MYICCLILVYKKTSVEIYYHCKKKVISIYWDDVTDVNSQSEDNDVTR